MSTFINDGSRLVPSGIINTADRLDVMTNKLNSQILQQLETSDKLSGLIGSLFYSGIVNFDPQIRELLAEPTDAAPGAVIFNKNDRGLYFGPGTILNAGGHLISISHKDASPVKFTIPANDTTLVFVEFFFKVIRGTDLVYDQGNIDALEPLDIHVDKDYYTKVYWRLRYSDSSTSDQITSQYPQGMLSAPDTTLPKYSNVVGSVSSFSNAFDYRLETIENKAGDCDMTRLLSSKNLYCSRLITDAGVKLGADIWNDTSYAIPLAIIDTRVGLESITIKSKCTLSNFSSYTSDAVGTFDEQTLTNKTLIAPVIKSTSSDATPTIKLSYNRNGDTSLNIDTDATAAWIHPTSEANPASDIGLILSAQGAGSVRIGNDIVTTNAAAQTLTNKTLSSPIILEGLRIKPETTYTTPILDFYQTADLGLSVDGLSDTARLRSVGEADNIGLSLKPKGTGKVMIGDDEIVTCTTKQHINNKTLLEPMIRGGIWTDVDLDKTPDFTTPILDFNQVQNSGIVITGESTYTKVQSRSAASSNLDLILSAKGTGKVQVDDDEVTTNTAAQTLTNKTLIAPVITEIKSTSSDATPTIKLSYNRNGDTSLNIDTDATTAWIHPTSEANPTSDIGLILSAQGNGSVRIGNDIVTTNQAIQTLTNKTLVDPTIVTSNNTYLRFTNFDNTNTVRIYAAHTTYSDVDLKLATKGAGKVVADLDHVVLNIFATAGVDKVYLEANAPTSQNVDLVLKSKGTGKVLVNNDEVLTRDVVEAKYRYQLDCIGPIVHSFDPPTGTAYYPTAIATIGDAVFTISKESSEAYLRCSDLRRLSFGGSIVPGWGTGASLHHSVADIQLLIRPIVTNSSLVITHASDKLIWQSVSWEVTRRNPDTKNVSDMLIDAALSGYTSADIYVELSQLALTPSFDFVTNTPINSNFTFYANHATSKRIIGVTLGGYATHTNCYSYNGRYTTVLDICAGEVNKIVFIGDNGSNPGKNYILNMVDASLPAIPPDASLPSVAFSFTNTTYVQLFRLPGESFAHLVTYDSVVGDLSIYSITTHTSDPQYISIETLCQIRVGPKSRSVAHNRRLIDIVGDKKAQILGFLDGVTYEFTSISKTQGSITAVNYLYSDPRVDAIIDTSVRDVPLSNVSFISPKRSGDYGQRLYLSDGLAYLSNTTNLTLS